MFAPQANKVIDRCRELAHFSEMSGGILRTYLSEPMRRCYQTATAWMEHTGMQVKVDASGNLRGVYGLERKDSPMLLVGSHLDTVRAAGAFDGILGYVLALALVEELNGARLPFAVEVIGFSEEEGVRFGLPFIGSRALVGSLDDATLQTKDNDAVTIEQAIRDFGLNPAELPAAALDSRTFAFLEFHIEQGPVLDSLSEPIAVVDAIAGQSRADLVFKGQANHAGTTPMNLRRDALAGASEWIAEVEKEARATPGLVATVGKVDVLPGISNVVPGEVRASLDVRHAVDAVRLRAFERLREEAKTLAERRGLTAEWIDRLNQSTTPMDAALTASLASAAKRAGVSPRHLTSGAGHDAMILAQKIPSCMLFLRSPGGISHHPDESVLAEDVAIALHVGLNFIQHLGAAPFA